MARIVRELLGEDLDAVRRYIASTMNSDDPEGTRVGKIIAYEVDPESVLDDEWHRDLLVDPDGATILLDDGDLLPVHVIARVACDIEVDGEYGGYTSTGWDCILSRTDDGYKEFYVDAGASGPAFNGCYDADSERECHEWVDELSADIVSGSLWV